MSKEREMILEVIKFRIKKIANTLQNDNNLSKSRFNDLSSQLWVLESIYREIEKLPDPLDIELKGKKVL